MSADCPPKWELSVMVADVLVNCRNIPAEYAQAVRNTATLIRKKKPDVKW